MTPATNATPETPETPKENGAPRLLPLTILLSALFWIAATTGGRQVFVKEVLGSAWDSQGEHFLKGDVGVDGGDIQWEAMVAKGRTFMYFGPFPAFVRIPLNFLYPAGRGAWSRFAGFCAGVIALTAFAGLVRDSLRSSSLSPRWRNWVGNFCLLGFAFGSPLLFFLASPTIYNEAILWGLAWSIAALYFANRCRMTEGAKLTRALLGFSICVSGALLSRLTFGAPLLLMAPLLAFNLFRRKEIRNLAALLLPLGAAFVLNCGLNYAKSGSISGTSLEYYTNGQQKEFAQKHGVLRLERVPYSFVDYFFLRHPARQHGFPFLKAERFNPYNHPTLYVNPFTETFSSLIATSSWILLGAIPGLVLLFRPSRSDWLDRGIFLALLFQVIVIMSFMGLAQRYIAEIFPFLVFCFVLFLRSRGPAVFGVRYALMALVVFSIVVNTLGTASIVGNDGNLPKETRIFWTMGEAK